MGKMKKGGAFGTGFGTGAVTRIIPHELGHGIAAKLLGVEEEIIGPGIELKDYGLTGGSKNYESAVGNNFLDAIVNAGGPIANYLVGLGCGGLANKIDGKKSPKKKLFLNGISIFNSWHPAVYCLADFYDLRGGYLKDFEGLAGNGLGFEYTIPLTIAASAALTYYNIKGWKDSVKDKTKRIYYNDGFWENRKNWKEKKEETIKDFERYFEGIDYEPSLSDKIKSKVLRKGMDEIKAKKAWKRMNKIEVEENDYKDKDVEKLAKEMEMDLGEAITFVDEYVWEHEDFGLE